jgi:carboxymethylenebutenolidase
MPCCRGGEDEFISKTAQAKIKAALAKKPNATAYSYPGQRHAFSPAQGGARQSRSGNARERTNE